MVVGKKFIDGRAVSIQKPSIPLSLVGHVEDKMITKIFKHWTAEEIYLLFYFPTLAAMLLYSDTITGDEMFSDAFPL